MEEFIKQQSNGDHTSNANDFIVVKPDCDSPLGTVLDPDIDQFPTHAENAQSFQFLYDQFSEKYGVSIEGWDLSSVSSTFVSLISTDRVALYELLLSKGFGVLRLAVFQKIFTSAMTLLDRITSRENLESDAVELNVSLMKELLSLLKELDMIYKEVRITDEDLKLARMAKDIKSKEILGKGDESGAIKELTGPEIAAQLEQLRKFTTKPNPK